MTTDISTFKVKRGHLKQQNTLFKKFLTNLVEPYTDLVLTNIERRLKRFEQNLDLYNDVQNELDALVSNDDELQQNLKDREDFENDFYDIVAITTTILNQNRRQEHSEQDSASSVSQSHHVGNFLQTNVQLPIISLKTFDGKFSTWREYKDNFVSIIHSNTAIPKVQKLAYLRSSLKGEPSDMVRSLNTTNENYDIAWEKLNKRYDNERKIVDNHVQLILDAPAMGKDQAKTLRNLINEIETNVLCLKSLDIEVDKWNPILIPIILSKVDFSTKKEWESKLNSKSVTKIPTLDEFMDFLNSKQSTLETVTKGKPRNEEERKQTRSFMVTNTNQNCPLCKETHRIQDCEQYKELTTDDRNKKARELKLCINCLRRGHFINNCTSKSACKLCKKKHHTSLHKDEQPKQENINCTAQINCDVLLSTALVQVKDSNGNFKTLRVLLDSGSQSNFITESACQSLKLKCEPISIDVTGISGQNTGIKNKCTILMKSTQSNYKETISCLVVKKITAQIPVKSFDRSLFRIPSNIKLSDPNFYNRAPIDLLIGSSLFWDLICVGRIREQTGPIFQKTKLGWIVTGNVLLPEIKEKSVTCLSLQQLHADVEKFWKSDEFVENKRILTKEEIYCEEYFKKTTYRNVDGRFVVSIPKKDEKLNELGNTLTIAKKRLKYLERKFEANEKFQEEYKKFMTEYIHLGHMSETIDETGFYLPHHGVVNEHSESTKLRVVFDGSCQPEDGVSVNEIQYTGPTIQDDLFSILARFRTYKYVLTGDISKMYRQVMVNEKDRHLQKIIWRETKEDEIKHYHLNTVTYGTTAAPYLAIRCLYQLGLDYAEEYPNEARIIREDFYVDDVLTGSDSIEELKNIKTTLTTLLEKGKFTLTKFKSNVTELCDNINETRVNEKLHKTLGIYWNSDKDEFVYCIAKINKHMKITKRTILATTATLFDPLGLISPVIIRAKLILQELWQMQLEWDESVSLDLANKWMNFVGDLDHISKIGIPRRIIDKANEFELHTFCDASEVAYGICIYIRSLYHGETTSIKLLASKTRVAPLSKKLSIPRLELNAAVLGADLAFKFKTILNLKFTKEFYWSDSTITLAWINGTPQRWNIYVANRVTHIQKLTNQKDWQYVATDTNPADILTRGVTATALLNCDMWWTGPSWLYVYDSKTSHADYWESNEEERKPQSVALATTAAELSFIKNYSSFSKLIRITAIILRFKENCQKSRENRKLGTIKLNELNNAKQIIIKMVQQNTFSEEIKCLEKGSPIPKKSKLLSLTPFIDSHGILRVGGRIQESDLSYDAKHPIILPNHSHFTNLVIRFEHLQSLHAGPSLLLHIIREKYWPIGAKNLVKGIIRNCIVCCKYTSKVTNPIMGNLPRERITPTPPFFCTGIDFAGPYHVKESLRRNSSLSKCYIAVFVCFSTKALHLELVSNLTTKAFLACLHRFISRRGKPSVIQSDNGTTFIGAKNELNALQTFLMSNNNQIERETGEWGITWKLIPPYSPNFGGLWEAGVKSVKYHLKRTLTNTAFTFEELTTLLTQIEALLNSRPLTPLSNDPDDLNVLTPAHFLIGRTFTTVCQPELTDVKLSRLSKYEQLQKILQTFWKKWQQEYLHTLQQRHKWTRKENPHEVGSIVIIKEVNTPPANWRIGRIIEVIYGKDKVPRVVNIRTAKGVLTRPISKLIPLPVEQEH